MKSVVDEAVEQHMTHVTLQLRLKWCCYQFSDKAECIDAYLYWKRHYGYYGYINYPYYNLKLHSNDRTMTIANTTISPALSERCCLHLRFLPLARLHRLFIFFSSIHFRHLCYSFCIAIASFTTPVVNATLRIPSNPPKTLFTQPPPTAFPLYPVSWPCLHQPRLPHLWLYIWRCSCGGFLQPHLSATSYTGHTSHSLPCTPATTNPKAVGMNQPGTICERNTEHSVTT